VLGVPLDMIILLDAAHGLRGLLDMDPRRNVIVITKLCNFATIEIWPTSRLSVSCCTYSGVSRWPQKDQDEDSFTNGVVIKTYNRPKTILLLEADGTACVFDTLSARSRNQVPTSTGTLRGVASWSGNESKPEHDQGSGKR
jgi:hypothetical protein